jgi:hypothetical protein
MILSSIKEGSEETRNRRAVRRYLNKKKERGPDRQDESTQFDEMTFLPGSMGHMMTAVHHKHTEGHESPHYHIHPVGVEHASSTTSDNINHTHYMVIHKHALPGTERTPAHLFDIHRNEAGQHEVHHLKQVY